MSAQIMHQQALTSVIETLINSALTLDGRCDKALNKLEGKSLSVKLAELSFTLTLTVAHQKILVTTLEQHWDCLIDCNVKVLTQIKNAQSLTALIKTEQLAMKGDLKIAQQFAALAEQIDIDWQQQLATHLGDVAAYKLSILGNHLVSKLSFIKKQVSADASEYLLHEKQLVCSPAQISQFNQAVVETAKHVDTLAERIIKLKQQLTS